MNYEESIRFIENIFSSLGSDYSLKEVTQLAERANNPHEKLNIIHIAGTNGKGSVGNFISNMLAKAGYRIGRYVSPTLFSYNERIQLVYNNRVRYASENEIAEKLSFLRFECEDMVRDGYNMPTAFEIETIMSLMLFKEWDVDFVVMECGLGGKNDATNFIDNSILSVITSISLDHTKILGNDILSIAKEKAGIIKEKGRLVYHYNPLYDHIIVDACKEKKCKYKKTKHPQNICVNSIEKNISFVYEEEKYIISHMGYYQIENAVLALEAIKFLEVICEISISYDDKYEAIAESKWPGRFDVICENPLVIVDGAHNEDGAKNLLKSLELLYPDNKFRFVTGVFRDKDYKKMLKIMLPLAQEIFTVSPKGERGLESNILADQVKNISPEIEVNDCGTVSAALDMVCEKKDNIKTVLFGSLSLMKDAYSFFGKGIHYENRK